MIEAGTPDRLGATLTSDGVNFAVHANNAERVELCLFDAAGHETHYDLPSRSGDIWHGHLNGCAAGQAYGYRVHGVFDPARGLRANPAKLLLDPYARELVGEFKWSPPVFDHRGAGTGITADDRDSAPFVPKAVVAADANPAPPSQPRIPWTDTLIYEANVRGYTMRHPDVPKPDRGRFTGMCNGEVLGYLKSLGISTVELMPVFEFIDERFLAEQGLRNLWGYNTIGFFSPARRYAQRSARSEFKEMVNAIHDAGMEVILDVVYNHTGESGFDGPTVSFRGFDNLGYYRTDADDPSRYVNDTGTGNTLNMDSPHVRRFVLDSLGYWVEHMGVDGFRFDLAPVLGRRAQGFDTDHPFFVELRADSRLDDSKLIAEPWDAGPGGYQLGRFPGAWAEWNDQYRDSARRFWRGDANEAGEFAQRLHGSADIFEATGRGPNASINFITAHDGFTLDDLVSYEERHNEANGEDNEDGHAHNFSSNNGAEGPTDDPDIMALRRQQRLNFAATLLLAKGTPMLLAGDEFGNSQQGNNNVYAQDNPTGWVNWDGRDKDPEFLEALRGLIALRADIALLAAPRYFHGDMVDACSRPDAQWLRPDGSGIVDDDWATVRAFSMVLSQAQPEHGGCTSMALMINGSMEAERFTLPGQPGDWQVRFVSAAPTFRPLSAGRWEVPARSMVCATLDTDPGM